MANGLPERARMGTIMRGDDGKNYQYAETTGMAGATGPAGWIETTMAPTNGFLGNFNPDALLAISTGLLTGSNPQEQLGNAAMGFANYRKDARQRNMTMEMLGNNNPQLVQAVQAGLLSPADAFTLHYKQQQAEKEAQAKAQRPSYMAVGGKLFNENTGEWISPPVGVGEAAGEEWGLNPVWGKDKDGNVRLGQMSKSGKFKPLDTGDFTPTPGINNIDTGTEIITRNNRSGDTISVTPKNIAEAERQKEIGTAEGKAIGAASGDLQAGQNAKALLQSIRNDPNRERGTGKTSVFNALPGTAGFDFQRKVDQAKSGAFLTAIQQMRGLGQLSNAEGQTATDAVTRMNTAMTEEGFLEALNDYERIIDQGIARAQSRLPAQGGGGKQRLRFNPATGELE